MSEDFLKSFQKAGSSNNRFYGWHIFDGKHLQWSKEEVFSRVEPFSKLGFQIQSEKSKLVLIQEIEFLGFIISLRKVTLCLPGTKQEGTLRFSRIWQDWLDNLKQHFQAFNMGD